MVYYHSEDTLHYLAEPRHSTSKSQQPVHIGICLRDTTETWLTIHMFKSTGNREVYWKNRILRVYAVFTFVFMT